MFELNRDRVEVLFKNLERQMDEVAKIAVKELNELGITSVRFTAEFAGRTSGDVVISYSLGDLYTPGTVIGKSLMAVFEEFNRRRMWSLTHMPKMLTFDGSGDLKREIEERLRVVEELEAKYDFDPVLNKHEGNIELGWDEGTNPKE